MTALLNHLMKDWVGSSVVSNYDYSKASSCTASNNTGLADGRFLIWSKTI